MNTPYSFEIRQTERKAVCRFCMKGFEKNEEMVSWTCYIGGGSQIYLHFKCVDRIKERIENHKKGIKNVD